MKRILTSLFVVVIVSLLAVGASNAFFSDTETSTGNTFLAGEFDLLVNGEDNPDSVVNIEDLKPGDEWDVDKTLYIQNPAYVYLHIKDLQSAQGAPTEPEIEEESVNGEKSDIENYLTYDLKINDKVLVSFEDENLLPEMSSCWIPLGTIEANTLILLVQSFHFPSEITNWAQGDTLTFTEEFYAVQVRNNPNPTPPDTGSGRVWDPELKKCVDAEEVLVDTVFVDSTTPDPTTSKITLESGKEYRLEVLGTYIYWPSCPADNGGDYPPCIADAEYSLRPSTSFGPGWIYGDYVFPIAYPAALDLMVDGANIFWGSYDTGHAYSFDYSGTGSTASFSIFDTYYPDNSGGLTVNIYEKP